MCLHCQVGFMCLSQEANQGRGVIEVGDCRASHQTTAKGGKAQLPCRNRAKRGVGQCVHVNDGAQDANHKSNYRQIDSITSQSL